MKTICELSEQEQKQLVKAFQQINGLVVDGIIGTKTLAVLNKENMSRKLSEKGAAFIEREEGVILRPYRDSVGVWTIGIGSTRWEDGSPVKGTDKPITKERAMQLFKTTVKKYEDAVNKITSPTNQNQFDALVSLCYNIGVAGFLNSSVFKKVNANPNDPSINEAFKMWKNAGGKPILLNRRIREANLYFS